MIGEMKASHIQESSQILKQGCKAFYIYFSFCCVDLGVLHSSEQTIIFYFILFLLALR